MDIVILILPYWIIGSKKYFCWYPLLDGPWGDRLRTTTRLFLRHALWCLVSRSFLRIKILCRDDEFQCHSFFIISIVVTKKKKVFGHHSHRIGWWRSSTIRTSSDESPFSSTLCCLDSSNLSVQWLTVVFIWRTDSSKSSTDARQTGRLECCL